MRRQVRPRIKKADLPPSHLEALILNRRDEIRNYLVLMFLETGWQKAAIKMVQGKDGDPESARRIVFDLFLTRDVSHVCANLMALIKIESELVTKHAFRPAEQFVVSFRYDRAQFLRVLQTAVQGEQVSAAD